jgi:hypothetical protein
MGRKLFGKRVRRLVHVTVAVKADGAAPKRRTIAVERR